ncbi:3-chloro-4-hydroxyphenylacetate reductive dehalogenase [Geodia barretti]|uniref:3-chloro-4-hydroxyphenylacetate reductive dehalogenase n=1 Tax=Geodia barretti TaxID=519541 RepID=A0AA35W564_GEOBA|nr:3-chloro-4-hydroxyphenylacetate reductive dehalogenase [Geodia barretti]
MVKQLSHTVKRPGRLLGDPDVEIPVAEDLASVPGVPQNPVDVAFYSREYPLETQTIEKSADRQWALATQSKDFDEFREGHDEPHEADVRGCAGFRRGRAYGDARARRGPHGRHPTAGARDGLRRGGIHPVRSALHFAGKKRWAKYEHAICLALEQDYVGTQTGPSPESDIARFETYEVEQELCLKMCDYLRSRGYHAQVHDGSDCSGPYIPLFVAAGLGQLGANGQLLSPHFGSRSRLMLVTTDAPLTYDKPVDYGIHKFCQQCQVCVNRCPGRAIPRDKVWWRGVERNKLIYDRCRPVMVTYHGCAVCMIVCPIQRYGMKPVMEHYVGTGEVLGKGSENLEGYSLKGKGYFGAGELPQFSRDFFEIPQGREEDWLFEKFKERLNATGVPSESELVDFANDVMEVLEKGETTFDVA